MRLGGAADVQVDQLVEKRLEDVAGADPGYAVTESRNWLGTAKPRRFGLRRARRTLSSGSRVASGPSAKAGSCRSLLVSSLRATPATVK